MITQALYRGLLQLYEGGSLVQILPIQASGSDVLSPLLVSVVANFLSESLKSLKQVFTNRITIIRPRDGETLNEKILFEPGVCYPVRGKLRSLLKDHAIWLLIKAEDGRVKPQGFYKIIHHADGEWKGYIHPEVASGKSITILAVVAPPSAQSAFRYYQEHGDATNWSPLDHLPRECKNAVTVQALVP